MPQIKLSGAHFVDFWSQGVRGGGADSHPPPSSSSTLGVVAVFGGATVLVTALLLIVFTGEQALSFHSLLSSR